MVRLSNHDIFFTSEISVGVDSIDAGRSIGRGLSG